MKYVLSDIPESPKGSSINVEITVDEDGELELDALMMKNNYKNFKISISQDQDGNHFITFMLISV